MANTKSQWESLNIFLQWPGTKQGRLFSPLLLNRLLQVPAIATGHENEIKRLQIKRKKYNGPCLEIAYSKKPKETTHTQVPGLCTEYCTSFRKVSVCHINMRHPLNLLYDSNVHTII